MKCSKCQLEFEEKDIQLSHDIPKYLGGTDADGRHWLCKKCHDIYERLAYWATVQTLDKDTIAKCRENVAKFAKRYFK